MIAAGLALAAALGLAPTASASIGVGVQADPVRLAATAHPGASYALPSLFVVNTGSETESVSVEVKRLSAGSGLAIPPSWIRVGTFGSQLQPRQQVLVPLELDAPAGAKAGSYRSDIVVTGSDGAAAGGVRFGAAAATPLEFRLAPGPAGHGWLGLPAWKWWTAGALLLFLAVYIGARRTGWRVRIETKSSGGMYGP
jgi:hypothetical protein